MKQAIPKINKNKDQGKKGKLSTKKTPLPGTPQKIKNNQRTKNNNSHPAENRKPSTLSFDPHQIIKVPLSTEKCIRQVEFENKIVFIVEPHSSKEEIKKAVEELFKVKVIKVNLQNSFNGKKKAYVKLGKGSLASDVSADLGLI